jgi:hypothetical protein
VATSSVTVQSHVLRLPPHTVERGAPASFIIRHAVGLAATIVLVLAGILAGITAVAFPPITVQTVAQVQYRGSGISRVTIRLLDPVGGRITVGDSVALRLPLGGKPGLSRVVVCVGSVAAAPVGENDAAGHLRVVVASLNQGGVSKTPSALVDALTVPVTVEVPSPLAFRSLRAAIMGRIRTSR